MTTLAVVGGGIAGLAAARRLESSLPHAEITLVERSARLGGKLVTEHVDGFVVEGAADSFLSRKPRGVGLCEELGLVARLLGRRSEHARSFVRRGEELLPLPEGMTGLIPTDLDALVASTLLTAEGRARLEAERDLPPAPPAGDESIASFVTRRLGREAYERLVEPLMTGIFGGDGEQLSLEATFPNLRALEVEYGSLLAGLAMQDPAPSAYPAFVSLRGGTAELVQAVASSLERTTFLVGSATRLWRHPGAYAVELEDGRTVEADGVVLAVPAFATAELVAEHDPELAQAHAEIPHASSAIVTLGYAEEDVPHPLEGYGYVVPKAEGTDVLACSWSSSKWEGRARARQVLIRVYVGRFGQRDVTELPDHELVALAREELRVLAIEAEPGLTWIHRWPRGMPQYTLGHPERLARIEAALESHPGLALAGAAYRGVGIPDCIESGEQAAEVVSRALARVPG
jgi:protoporphyrinogen/coproporphyrinogen III oxidase